jgi:beta-lactamase regulating signal transducer with metallopeptidase domain/roadblock/LC7 domain-containing protein
MVEQWVATINQWVDTWGTGMWRACWQGSAAILFVWGLCRVLPQMSPRVRCWLWRLAYIKLIIAPLWISPVGIPVLRSIRAPETISAPIQAPAIHPTSYLPRLRMNGTVGPAHVVITKTSLTPLSALVILWLLGGIVMGAQIIREWRSARLRGRVAPQDIAGYTELAADFERLCRRFGVRRPIALLVTNASDRPHVFGVIHPVIVLPASLLAESDRPGLLAVLAHEIAHVQRKDLLWNWLPAVAHLLFFFCPFVWLANREWQIAQEIACDEIAVLNTRTDVAAYGEMLVRMVTPYRHRSARRGIAALGIVETPQTLKRRLIAMRSIHPVSRRKLALAAGSCVVLGIFGIVPWQVVAQEARTNRILFVSNRIDANRFSIFAMDPDGSHITRLTHGPVPEFDAVSAPNHKTVLHPIGSHRNEMELDPVWSPDGKRIAFTLAVPEKPEPEAAVKTNVYVMNADGSNCKQVTYFSYGMEAAAPAWSPDGKYIAFTLQFRDKGAPGGISATICVTDLTGFWPIAEGMWPRWSPDGKKVLYSAFAEGKGMTTDLYEADASGIPNSNVKKLVDGVLQGAWSPDGKHLAYISMMADPNGDKIGNIVISNADGSQPKQLTNLHGMGPIGLQWSSDGRQIYFTRPVSPDAARTVNYQIYAMEADGSHMRALTTGDAPDYLGGTPGLLLANNWMGRIATIK